MIKEYRKKNSLVVQAIQLKRSKYSFDEVYKFIGNCCAIDAATDGTFINVVTPNGIEKLHIDNFVVKYSSTEYCIMKSDRFREVFEEVI